MFKRVIKYFLLIILTAATTTAILYKLDPMRERRMEGYRNAAEWGCYSGVMYSTSKLKNDYQIYIIREGALTFCPEAAKKFELFIRNGR